MLAYAAPRPGREANRPKLLMAIIAGHVLAIGAVMLAKSEIATRIDRPTVIIDIPPIADPLPIPEPRPRTDPRPSHSTTTQPQVPIPTFDNHQIDVGPVPLGPADLGSEALPPRPPFVPPHEVIRHGAQIATAEGRLRPPYPEVKQMLGEEATLTLKLSIDATGRVTAVEPIGSADRAFLDSARRHLLNVWRFTPATEDGKPVPSTKVITLHFKLGEA
ncbi:TonB family protein [Sphingomonas sp.]|uniref:energy transducer TonB n=1 Tax=Sphingomonas sp. TaxID=28214 RepID=UPI00286D60BB|nr:TonB family protein [Sphingomonas sp.]